LRWGTKTKQERGRSFGNGENSRAVCDKNKVRRGRFSPIWGSWRGREGQRGKGSNKGTKTLEKHSNKKGPTKVGLMGVVGGRGSIQAQQKGCGETERRVRNGRAFYREAQPRLRIVNIGR